MYTYINNKIQINNITNMSNGIIPKLKRFIKYITRTDSMLVMFKKTLKILTHTHINIYVQLIKNDN